MMEATATSMSRSTSSNASHTSREDKMEVTEDVPKRVDTNGVDEDAASHTAGASSHATTPTPTSAPSDAKTAGASGTAVTPQPVQKSVQETSKSPPKEQQQPQQQPQLPQLPRQPQQRPLPQSARSSPMTTVQPEVVPVIAHQRQPSHLPSQAVPSSQYPQRASSFTPIPTASMPSTPLPARPAHLQTRSYEKSEVPTRFPSPDNNYRTHVPRFNRDLSLLADAVQQSCPEAIRRVIRDKWEKTIMGSDFHHAFLMNAIIHHASGVIMRRAVRDFGQNLVASSKNEIVAHLKASDIDEIAGAILEKCSDKFLDQALEKRLKTIEARPLINALARAERLGYESSDILEDRQEKVVPAAPMHSPGMGIPPQLHPVIPAFARASLPPQAQQTPRNPPPPTVLQCRLCWRSFEHTKPYEYHVQKQLCTKPPPGPSGFPFKCDHCGAGFTTKVGQQYHQANAVCGAHDTAAATPKPQTAPGSPMDIVSTQTTVPSHPTAYQPIPSTQPPLSAYQAFSTPVQSKSIHKDTPGSSQDDPYAHLTPDDRANLEEELRQAEMSYGPRFHEAYEIPDPNARRIKLESLQNTFSTKQSIIRKRYGVRLRQRRSKAEIDEERLRLASKHGPSSPDFETPSAKRIKTDDETNYVGGSRAAPPYTAIPPPSNHLSVSDMKNSGLGGSAATAAMADPTASVSATEQQPPQNSLSSLQRKGYRVSSSIQPASTTPIPHRNGSASAPVVLESSSDGDDTDEDIPATIPPKKAV